MRIDRKCVTRITLATSALALITLGSGCTPNDITMGAAVKHNYALQIVDPDPQHEGDVVAQGSQTAAAQERYRKGNVKKPVKVNTASGAGGGGSTR